MTVDTAKYKMVQYFKTAGLLQDGVLVKELFTMWKYGSMVALTVLCAGIYMLFLLPSKAIPILPGYTEIRPAALFPVIFGLLFGPAGAWGSAIGNLAGDLVGSFDITSVFGFMGNFLYALIPYKLWRSIRLKRGEDRLPTINSAAKLAEFGMVGVISGTACAIILAWGLDVLKLVPFTLLSTINLLNNTVITLIFGPIVLPVAYRFAKKAGVLWTDIMSVRDVSMPNPEKIHIFMIYSGAAGGLVFGLALALLFAGQTLSGQGLTTAGMGSPFVDIGVLPFLVILFYGAFNS